MKSRLSRLAALTVAGSLGLLGCEHWRNGLRKDGADSSSSRSAGSELNVPSSTHEPGGRSGALSDRGREIERNLNVGQ